MDQISFKFGIGTVIVTPENTYNPAFDAMNAHRIPGGPYNECPPPGTMADDVKFWYPILNDKDIINILVYESNQYYKILRVTNYHFIDCNSNTSFSGISIKGYDKKDREGINFYKYLPEAKYECINLLIESSALKI